GGDPVELPDRIGVLERERRGRAIPAGRVDREEVRAEGVQARRDVRRRPAADPDEGDDRRDPDDDAEHRQRRAEPARPETGEREADQLQRAHATSRPSRRWTARAAAAATEASWVMRTTVRPSAWSP